MSSGSGDYASLLKTEIAALNNAYAAAKQLPHAISYGDLPVTIYLQSQCGRHHGNFISASYRAIVNNPQWRKRLQKIHAQGDRSFPASDRRWRELDSCLSSDALLMNIFCYPGLLSRREVCGTLGIEPGSIPQFGFRPYVPLLNRRIERTEVDMKLDGVLFEAKLTESDFQIQRGELVEQYQDFAAVFDCGQLPKVENKYVSYQLIRNVLAAHALNLDFCLLFDSRRPDLLERWYAVARCIRAAALRSRCKVLSWQELAGCLPRALQNFLAGKYGICSPGN